MSRKNTKEIQHYTIDKIDFGHLCREFNDKSGFKNDDWEGHLKSVLKGLSHIQQEIIDASKKTSGNLSRGSNNLGLDHPTDIIWTLSIILTMRTIAILESKSRDMRRDKKSNDGGKNREAHKKILERYLDILKELKEQKGKYAHLFEYEE